MKTQLNSIFLLLSFIVIFASNCWAQSTFASEEELKIHANKLFNDDAFEEAYPLFSQLASLYPKDPNYSYRLGVCMLYASDDKERPLTFLEYAAKSPTVDKEVFFYLAKAYHLNYLFDLAIIQYQKYQKVASAAKAEKLQVSRQIEMCKNGKKLLRNLSDLVVIDKKEIDRTDFYRAYDISDIGGKLLAKPDEAAFKTSLDKKQKETSIIYFSSDNNQIYFSSYGDDISHGKDIYMIKKLGNGKLSAPQSLGYPINTLYDEDFPFLHPNGKVLYFCSKGHNSMGGYDIFKSTLNEETGTWNMPVNMDFPINSPDDDILYITNADEKEAYFSSARSSPTGKTNVYHISVERKAADVAIVDGVVVKNSGSQNLAVKITVKNIETNEIEEIANSKKEDGRYSLTLPNGANLMYTVEAPSFPTQSVMVTIPLQTSLKPFKQELSYDPVSNKLLVKNIPTGEETDTDKDESYKAALSFIKERSKMEVTPANNKNGKSNVEYLGKTDSIKVSSEKASTVKKETSFSNTDIIKIAYDDAKDVEQEAKKLKDQANTAFFMANQKNELAQNKFHEAAQLTEAAANTSNKEKKQLNFQEANAITNEAEEYNQQTVTAFNLATRLQSNAATKQKEADLSKQYAIDLEAAVKATNSQAALAKLDEQQKKIDSLNQENDESNIINNLKIDGDNKRAELDKAIQTSIDIKQEIIDSEELVANATQDAEKEKNETIKQGLLNQLEGLKEDKIETKKELLNNDLKIVKLQKEYDGLNSQLELVNSVLNKTAAGEDTKTAIAPIDKNKLEQQVNIIKKNNAKTLPNDQNTSVAATKPIVKKDSASTVSDATTNNPVKVQNEIDTKNDSSDIVKNKLAPIDTDKNDQNVVNNTVDTVNNNSYLTNADGSNKNKVTPIDKVKKDQSVVTNAIDTLNNNSDLTNGNGSNKNKVTPIDKGKKDQSIVNTAIDTVNNNSDLTNDNRSNKNKVIPINKGKKDRSIVNNSIDTVNNNSDLTNANGINKNKVTPIETDKNDHLAFNKGVDKVKNKADFKNDNENKPTSSIDDNNKTTDNSITDKSHNSSAFNLYNKKFENDLVDINAITDEKEKEKKRLDLFKNWIAAINKEIEVEQQQLINETDINNRIKLSNNTKELKKIVVEKQDMMEAASTTVTASNINNNNLVSNKSTTTINTKENINQQQAVADTTANSDITVNKLNKDKIQGSKSNGQKGNVVPQQHVDEKLTKANAEINSDGKQKPESSLIINGSDRTSEPINIESDTANQFKVLVVNKNNIENDAAADVYSSSIAKEQFAKAKKLNKEAADLTMQSNKIKIAAEKEVNSIEKSKLNKDAETKMQSADDKELEASACIALANEAEYNINQNALNQFANASTKMEADELATAGLMKDEANIYFKKAQVLRRDASPIQATYDKQKELSEASKNEMIALEKQRDALHIYKKYLPNYIILSPDEFAKADLEKTKTKNTVVINSKANENKELKQPNDSKELPIKEKINIDSQNQSNKITSIKTKEEETIPSTKNNDDSLLVNNNKTKNKENDLQFTEINVNKEKGIIKPITKESFETKLTPVYSTSKPIPINAALPEGLLFKVQIGAFRNAIPQDLFKGITPISGETTKEGFIRYTAGLFTNFKAADKVKQEIRQLGYSDAFVVAFYNGKRISVSAALSKLNSDVLDDQQWADSKKPKQDKVVLNKNDKNKIVSDEEKTEIAVTANNSSVIKKEELPITTKIKEKELNSVADTKNVLMVEGIFYTVQIGVFSKPVKTTELYNIQPLYTETTPEGYFRYNTGIYNDMAIALQAKNKVVGVGITDAFVTRYYKGKRLSVLEAARITAQGSTAMATSPDMNKMPIFYNKASQNIPTQSLMEKTKVDNNALANQSDPSKTTLVKKEKSNNVKSNIVFKVQIGVFKDQVPLDIANKFLKINKKGVSNYVDENGLIIYTVGNYKTLEEAEKERLEIIKQDISDPFIIADNNGKRISVDEAKKILNIK
ncbi:MAG: hypothetical protein ABI315_16225 [Bacteroidia bacterium]